LGELNCDTSAGLLAGTFEWISTNLPDIEYIFYTGDSANHNIPFQTEGGNIQMVNDVVQ